MTRYKHYFTFRVFPEKLFLAAAFISHEGTRGVFYAAVI